MRCHLQSGRYPSNRLVRDAVHRPKSPRPTDHRVRARHFATLNFLIYLLSWEKLLNLRRGVRVYRKRMVEQPIDDGSVEATVGFRVALREAFSDLLAVDHQ